MVTDDRAKAVNEAERLWMTEHRRCGVETVRNWNLMHPERPIRTTSRYLVFEEK